MVNVDFFSFVWNFVFQTGLVFWSIILKLVESKEVFVFLIIFYVSVVTLTRAMKSNQGAAIILSLITSLLAVRVLPDLGSLTYLPFEVLPMTLIGAAIVVVISIFFSTPWFVRKTVFVLYWVTSFLIVILETLNQPSGFSVRSNFLSPSSLIIF